MSHFIECLAIGLFTGIFSGTFGVGGGIICTPLLRLILQFEPHVAIGTTLALIVPTSMSGAYKYYKLRAVDTALFKMLALPAIAGTLLGAYLTRYVGGAQLMLSFAVLIAISGIDLFFGLSQKLKKKAAQNDQALNSIDVHYTLASAVPVGFVTGLLSGFFGVGGGFILIPILLAAYSMPVKQAFGTSLLIVALISIPGSISHFGQGHVDLGSATMMTLGAIPGSLIGTKIAFAANEARLRQAFGLLIVCVALLMVAREMHWVP